MVVFSTSKIRVFIAGAAVEILCIPVLYFTVELNQFLFQAI